MDDRRAVAAGPEVVALRAIGRADRAVCEPQGAVMRMVLLFAFLFGHRPVASQCLAARAVDRVEVRQVAAAVRRAVGAVLREGPAVDGDQDAVAAAAREFDPGVGVFGGDGQGSSEGAEQKTEGRGEGLRAGALRRMRARRPGAIRAPDDGRTEWVAGGAGSRHPGARGAALRAGMHGFHRQFLCHCRFSGETAAWYRAAGEPHQVVGSSIVPHRRGLGASSLCPGGRLMCRPGGGSGSESLRARIRE